MKLSTLAVLLGIGYSLPQIYGLIKPKAFTASLKQFPRSEWWGYLLMGIGAFWFLYNLNQETVSDFAAYKRMMLIGFGALAVGTCVFVRDFLAVRGLAITLLLLAWHTLNVGRWLDTQWRLVFSVWAYIWIVAGMWLTISPWRLRDYFEYLTASEPRLKLHCAARLAFGLFVTILGLTVLRG